MIRSLHIFAQVIERSELTNLPKAGLGEPTVTRGLQLIFAIAGAIAVLIVTIAALQYVVSQGDPQTTAKAKNTILYALGGLVVCITAFAIVTFVIARI